jgi:DNA-directed RNA polymerase beta' subunit
MPSESEAAMQKIEKLELIDWSERYPNESALQIAIRQSTYCLCGKAKEIGHGHCGCGKTV